MTRQASIRGIEMSDNGFTVSPHVGLLVKTPPINPPYTEREIEALAELRVHFVGYKRPADGRGLLTTVDISESIGPSGEGGRVIDLTKLPPGTTHIRIWGTK